MREQAVLSAIVLKKHDQAMELAQQIPLPPVSKTCQMRILSATRQWQQLVEKFGAEDISTWPEGMDAEAFSLRGGAYFQLKDGAKAAADLAKAGEYLTDDNSKGLALNALGDTCQHLLKDDVRALDAYRRVYTTGNIYKHCQAAISVVNIFNRQNKPDQAIAELDRIGLGKVTLAYWRVSMLFAYSTALARQGKHAEAIVRLNEALQVKDCHSAQKEACQKDIAKLQEQTQSRKP